MMYFHQLALRSALARLRHKPLGTFLCALVIAIALTLPMLGYVFMNNVSGLARNVSGKAEISIFMSNDAPSEQTLAVEKRLKADERVERFRFVPREVALSELSGKGGFSDITAVLESNPLPDAFVVEPKGNDPGLFDTLRAEFQNQAGVAHVQLDSVWVERLYALVQLGHSAVLFLAFLLGTTLVIVTFNTIRLQIVTRHREISVSLLLGATREFVRRPFLYFGFLQGLLGGLIAWGLTSVLLRMIGLRVNELAATYGINFHMAGTSAYEVLALLIFSSVLGWLGAALSVMRHLHDKVEE